VRAPDWLTAQPVAHRGLHDIARGIVENMPAAAEAAIARGFAIECDIQLTADGEAMVHHDHVLGRLTVGNGQLLEKTAAELKAVHFRNTAERMISLADLCALVAGRVPLVIEVKSHFDRDRKLVRRMAEVLSSYDGRAVGMSFDPDQVTALRELIPNRPRGIVAERHYTESDWPDASAAQRHDMTHLRHFFRSQPDFVAYRVDDLPAFAPWIARHLFGCRLLSWTVRTPAQRARGAQYADQIIFEGFVPEP
jgi:glycerophosphoryl diester phosphodiesterase